MKSNALSYDLEQIFNDVAQAKSPEDQDGQSFWRYVHALKKFYETNKRLPLSGQLPDMTATSDWYA